LRWNVGPAAAEVAGSRGHQDQQAVGQLNDWDRCNARGARGKVKASASRREVGRELQELGPSEREALLVVGRSWAPARCATNPRDDGKDQYRRQDQRTPKPADLRRSAMAIRTVG